VPDLTIARSFSYSCEAELARSALEAAGIEASIRNGNVVRLDWFLSNAVGGVCVMVPRDELDRAREILASEADVGEELPQRETVGCPRCGGESDPVHPPLAGRWLAWIWFVIAIDAWPTVRRRRCQTCGHTRRPE
jgi:hypothetical protein